MASDNASLKSRPTPEGGRYLIIVARDQPDLWEYLRRNLVVEDGVEVIHDRRQGGRWQWNQTRDLQVQGKDRRISDADPGLRYRSFVIVPKQDIEPGG